MFNVISNMYIKSESLVKIRLCFYTLTLTYLFLLTIKLLPIDFREAKDPALWKYHDVRFRLITVWFNILLLVYMPVCIYCEWRDLKGESHLPHVILLNKIRYYCFTSILFPVIIFSDIIFWSLWNIDTKMIVPLSIEEMIPLWVQHCFHTVTLIIVTLDFLLLPRQKPENLKLGVILLFATPFGYLVMSAYSISKGECIYPFVETFSTHKLLIFALYILVGVSFYYTCQLYLMDMLWGQKKNNDKKVV